MRRLMWALVTTGCATPPVEGPPPSPSEVANLPPSLVVTAFATGEDQPLFDQLLAVDPEDDPVTFRLLAGSPEGDLTLAEDGSFAFLPPADWSGEVSFDVVLSDPFSDAAPATVFIAVGARNDAPVCDSGSFTMYEDTELTKPLVARDVDDEDLDFAIEAEPAHGTLTIDADAAMFTYAPDPDYFGPDAFRISAHDGSTSSVPARIDVEVVNVDDPPRFTGSGPYALQEDVPLTAPIPVIDIDSAFTVTLVDPPLRGAVSFDLVAGTFTYVPQLDTTGADSFTIVASDQRFDVGPSRIDLFVDPINDPPVVPSLQLSTVRDQPVSAVVVATDPELDALQWSITDPPSFGTATLSSVTGALTYTPQTDYVGPDVLIVAVSDGSFTTNGLVTISVTPN